MQVLLEQPLVIAILHCQVTEGIICFHEVLDDGTRLPKGEIVVVWIDYDRCATIGVQPAEGLALDVLDLDFFIRNTELFQRDQDLEGVWAASCESLAVYSHTT